MKANVIKTFRDKNTGIVHEEGQEIDVTQERFEEINSTALGVFVEAVLEPKKTAKKK